MESIKIAGESFLSNLQNQRFELELPSNLQQSESITNSELLDSIEIEIFEKDIEKDIDIKNYLDKPIELLIKDNIEIELSEEEKNTTELKFYLEEKNQSIIDIEFIDEPEKQISIENINCEIQKNNESLIEQTHQTLLLKSLQEKLSEIQIKLDEKDKKILTLKEENKNLQKTLISEQDVVVNEKLLYDKTLTKVEQLLLEKRSELIERQKISRRNWLFKLIDKVKS